MTGLWRKSEAAAEEARVLAAARLFNGATNRAYYAMFDAALTALAVIDPGLADAKSHKTVISRFGKHVVKGCGLDPALGRILSGSEGVRSKCDSPAAL